MADDSWQAGGAAERTAGAGPSVAGRAPGQRPGLSMSSQVTCALYPLCSSSFTHSTLCLIREAALYGVVR